MRREFWYGIVIGVLGLLGAQTIYRFVGSVLA